MQNEPLWPSPEALIQINADEVAATGEPHALLSPSLLESAWAKPINRWSCENVTDIVPLAVALMVGIAQNHPFQQGNKLTAFQAGVVFMEANNLRLAGSADTVEFADAFVRLVEHAIDEGTFVDMLRPHVIAYPGG